MTEQYVCNICGTAAWCDTRGGSLDAILLCECADQKVWIDDGRGGYWFCRAKAVTTREFEQQNS